jgi:hypothetical protein
MARSRRLRNQALSGTAPRSPISLFRLPRLHRFQ